jgi:plastocyanin domain-containing protein
MSFNPYGPESETKKHAQRIYQIVSTKSLKTVCGYNYIANFAEWLPGFERLLLVG